MARRRETPGPTPEVIPEGHVTGKRGALRRVPPSLRSLIKVHQGLHDPLHWVLEQIPGGTQAVLALLQLSNDPEAVRLCEVVRRFQTELHVEGGRVLHEILEHADLTPRDFVGVVSRVAFDFNIALGQSIAAMQYPKMMEMSMRRAQQMSATDERKMHFQASGYLPTPSRGIQIGIRNTNTTAPVDDAPPAPGRPASFDRTARQVVRELPPVREGGG